MSKYWTTEGHVPEKLKREGGAMSNIKGSLKRYFNDNQDTIITILFVVLLDNYLFGGTLRQKTKSLLENLFNSAEAKLVNKAEEKTE